jgi:hypothetical protein
VRVPTSDLAYGLGDVVYVGLVAEQHVLREPYRLLLAHALRDRAVERGRDVVQEAAQPLQAAQKRRGLVVSLLFCISRLYHTLAQGDGPGGEFGNNHLREKLTRDG